MDNFMNWVLVSSRKKLLIQWLLVVLGMFRLWSNFIFQVQWVSVLILQQFSFMEYPLKKINSIKLFALTLELEFEFSILIMSTKVSI